MILAIETSCDETSVAVTKGRRVITNIISSQVDLHRKYGGVVPAIAKRAHEERIEPAIKEALKKSRISTKEIKTIAVTVGPGLAIALEVGIKKAKELSLALKKPLIAVNHMEGHIYSCFAQNRNGNPKRKIAFPALCILVSGGHTQLVIMKNHGQYKLLGETRDDAAGEALDKAAKILKLGYPGGPVIERLAQKGNPNKYPMPRPLFYSKTLDYSFSGLKTHFLYLVQEIPPKKVGVELKNLAASFQEAVFDSIIKKTQVALQRYHPPSLLAGGGVIANKLLRRKVRSLVSKYGAAPYFPPKDELCTDNAAMIGVCAYFMIKSGKITTNLIKLDRKPNLCFQNG